MPRNVSKIRKGQNLRSSEGLVYIPAYNCIDFIEQAVESALNQSFTDLEVVICNDGSTDGTGELLDELYGEHPRVVIIHQENGGISNASNTAIRAGRGEYILQLDADDVLLPIAAESLVRVFEENKVDIGFVYGDSYLINANNEDLGHAYSWSVYSRQRLSNGMMIHHPRMFVVAITTAPLALTSVSPTPWTLTFFSNFPELTTGYHLQMPMYLYRQHEENTSKVDKSDQDTNTHYCVRQHLERTGLSEESYQNRPLRSPERSLCPSLNNLRASI